MKRCKKILACALALCLVMGVMSMPALAARMEEEEVVMTAPAAEEVESKTSSERPSQAAPAALLETAAGTDDEIAVKAALTEALQGAKFVGIIAAHGANGALTKVVGTVDGDYKAVLTIPGTIVNTDNVTVGVGMKDVASLGVTGERTHVMSLETGITSQDVELAGLLALFDGLNGTKINASIVNGDELNAKAVSYDFAVTGEAGQDKVITATPNTTEAARAAWHHMMKNFTATTQENPDSFLLVKNGSWLQVGKEKLVFEENYSGDLKLDDLQNMNVSAIKAAVKVEETEDAALKFVLKKGTQLAVSSSVITLDEDVEATVTGVDADTLAECKMLSELRTAANKPEGANREIVKTLVTKTMATVLGMVGGKTVGVTMQFNCTHDWELDETAQQSAWTWTKLGENAWQAAVKLYCTKCDCGTTETVNGVADMTVRPNCTKGGYTVYTAKVTVDGQEFTTSEKLDQTDPSGHSYVWASNGSSGHTGTCSVCGDTVTEAHSGNPCAKCDYTAPSSGGGGSYTPAPTPDEELEEPDTPLVDKPFLFEDVAEADWFYDAVKFAVESGIMKGVSDTVFSPMEVTTRGSIITMIHRLEAEPEGLATFPDVASTEWYGKAVAWGADHGIVKGYDDGTFAPNESITREQMAAILYRYAGFKGYDVSASAELDAFADGGEVSSWAQEAVRWAVGVGLIHGKGGNRLDPAGTASRGEAAAMMMRFNELVAQEG